MGQSLSLPGAEPDGKFSHQPSGSTVAVYRQNGVMHHNIEEHGLSADYPIAYAVGFGSVGRSYLIQLGGRFFQSPAAFYSARSEWGASPGYESERVLDFTRSITSDCLVCHAGAMKKVGAGTELTPIACDRCHGDSGNHRLRPVAGSIVNPAKLPVRERDSVCEQCHLESATVVLNPGRYWWDFHPGQPLEQVETHYVYRTTAGEQLPIGAVSQAEQLAMSACLRGSGGKLWCGTCHDPHGARTDRQQQIRQVCESCHPAPEVLSIHKAPEQECVSCHMPRRQAVDVSHAAITDHRIAKRPAEIVADVQVKLLAPWHDPEPELARRDLGLAHFNVAKREASGKDFEIAFELLSALPESKDDPPVSAALGYMLLGTGRAPAAVRRFELAVRSQPTSSEYWLDLGVAQNTAGDSASAIASFRHSIEANPYDYRPYKALSDLYKRESNLEDSRKAVSDFLRWVPQSITMRLSY